MAVLSQLFDVVVISVASNLLPTFPLVLMNCGNYKII